MASECEIQLTYKEISRLNDAEVGKLIREKLDKLRVLGKDARVAVVNYDIPDIQGLMLVDDYMTYTIIRNGDSEETRVIDVPRFVYSVSLKANNIALMFPDSVTTHHLFFNKMANKVDVFFSGYLTARFSNLAGVEYNVTGREGKLNILNANLTVINANKGRINTYNCINKYSSCKLDKNNKNLYELFKVMLEYYPSGMNYQKLKSVVTNHTMIETSLIVSRTQRSFVINNADFSDIFENLVNNEKFIKVITKLFNEA